jgi:glucan-binding YG repeat protein
MDQTISAARITNDPITRGYRTYFGEAEMTENDMSPVFGWDETKDLDGKETFKFFVNNLDMEPDEAKHRTKQQGKDPSGKRDKKSKYKNDKNFISRQILPEIQKQKAIKVLEDILVNKKNKNTDISDKEPRKVSSIVKKNLTTLKKQAEKEGLSISELIKMLKGE